MANYIMIRDGNRKDNGCPGYIKYTEPDGRLVVQIHDSARNSSPFMEGDDPIRDENGR